MKNNIYNRRLNQILKKHSLYQDKFYNDSKVIFSILSSILLERCQGKKIAFWGIGPSIGQKSHVSVLT